MRIALLTHEPFFPPSGGGSAEAVYLVREFRQRGHGVHLFCPTFTDADAIALRMGLSLHLFTKWAMGRYTRLRNFKYLLYPAALAALVRDERSAFRRRTDTELRFDLMFAQHTISAAAAGNLRRELGVPVVLNFLDYLTGFMETWPHWVMPRPVGRALTRYELGLPRRYDVEGVLTVSTPLAERFAVTGFPRDRIRPIQYGYDSALFRPAEATPANSPGVVVMHGSFDQHHLGAIARTAVIHVARVRPQTVFRFVGRETPALNRFVAGVRNTVPAVKLELPGFVPYAEVARQLQNADVGIVPYEESNGTHCAFVAKAVEYLGCGLAVVSTPLENLSRYFAGEPALRFSQFDGESFGRELLAALDTPPAQRREAGLRASQRVARELDWRAVTGAAVDSAEAVAAGRSIAPAV
jgi:glycosyltransferase involved in cell wall biosynthesis